MRSHSLYVTGLELGRVAMPDPICTYLIAGSVGPDLGDADVDAREVGGSESSFGENACAAVAAILQKLNLNRATFGGEEPDFRHAQACVVCEFFLSFTRGIGRRADLADELGSRMDSTILL